MENSHKFAGF